MCTLSSEYYIYNSSLFTVNNKTFEGTARIVEQDNDPKLAAEVQNLMSIKNMERMTA